jgi:diaminohydroxyphosphoribosylaminopyrimidine deaminase/5-amino-6-(5-phosphoribosylamino)uracil reductase
VDRREEERAAMARALELAQSPGVPLCPKPRVGTVMLAADGTTLS